MAPKGSGPKRNTVQRQAIFDSVKELNAHATAEQVYAHVVKKHPAISKATVYRNLGQMAEAGELLNIGHFCGGAHYDHNFKKHYHFICEKCRQVFDVNEYFPGLEGSLKGLDGFQVTGCLLTFSGLCSGCKEKTAREERL